MKPIQKSQRLIVIIEIVIIITSLMLIITGHINENMALEISGEATLTFSFTLSMPINIYITKKAQKVILENVNNSEINVAGGDIVKNNNENNYYGTYRQYDIELAKDSDLSKVLKNYSTVINDYYDNHRLIINKKDGPSRLRIKQTIINSANYNVVSDPKFVFNDEVLVDLFKKIKDDAVLFKNIQDQDIWPNRMSYSGFKALVDDLETSINKFYARVAELAKNN